MRSQWGSLSELGRCFDRQTETICTELKLRLHQQGVDCDVCCVVKMTGSKIRCACTPDDRMHCTFRIVPRDQRTRCGDTEDKIKVVFSDLKWQGSGYVAQTFEIEHDADDDNRVIPCVLCQAKTPCRCVEHSQAERDMVTRLREYSQDDLVRGVSKECKGDLQDYQDWSRTLTCDIRNVDPQSEDALEKLHDILGDASRSLYKAVSFRDEPLVKLLLSIPFVEINEIDWYKLCKTHLGTYAGRVRQEMYGRQSAPGRKTASVLACAVHLGVQNTFDLYNQVPRTEYPRGAELSFYTDYSDCTGFTCDDQRPPPQCQNPSVSIVKMILECPRLCRAQDQDGLVLQRAIFRNLLRFDSATQDLKHDECYERVLNESSDFYRTLDCSKVLTP
eukprot:COSAG01_NODE_365_length_18082_cov_9.136518_6_plen_389_part_00